ncbi:FkbM family methyltransferase [Pseudaestuariivita rosea]|uniref:FkbM family methyltransferase n=1 Tax=Pseudaestuariivita rosea TaxID=2763263 RepID=UPI0030141BA2
MTYDGQKFTFVHSDQEDHIFKTLQNSQEFYEQALLERLRILINPDDLVLDVGANIGTHSVFFAGVCKAQVIAFEPNQAAYGLLEQNIKLNRLKKRVTMQQFALGQHYAQGAIVDNDANNLGMATVEAGQGDVQIRPLDTIDLPKAPRLIKVDVEGMEREVIDGAIKLIKRDAPIFVIESATFNGLAAITRRLEPLGYDILEVHNFTPTYILAPKIELERYIRTTLSQLLAGQAFSQLAVDQHIKNLKHSLAGLASSAAITALDDRLVEGGKQVADLHGTAKQLLDTDTAQLQQISNVIDVLNALKLQSAQSTSELGTRLDRGLSAVDQLAALIQSSISDLRDDYQSGASDEQVRDLKDRLEERGKQIEDILVATGDLLNQSKDYSESSDRLLDRLTTDIGGLQVQVDELGKTIDLQSSDKKIIAIQTALSEIETQIDALTLTTKDIQATGQAQNTDLSDIANATAAFSSDLADLYVLNDGLREDAIVSSHTNRQPMEIPYLAMALHKDWCDWRHHQKVRLGSNGHFEIQQANSTPGVQSPRLPVPGPGLHSVQIAFENEPGSNWILQIQAAVTGEVLHPDVPLVKIKNDIKIYLPRRISEILLKVVSRRPFIGQTAQLKEVILSKVDDEGVYRHHAKMIAAPVIASMASIPSRRDMLYDSVHSMLPQCDEVRIFLNGYGDVPDFLNHPRVRIRRSEDYDDMGDAGKFGWFDEPDPPGYRVIMDDDLVYPPDLVKKLVGKVRETGDRAMVGLHGVIIRQPITEYYKPENRRVFHFQNRTDATIPVHVLATCVMCAHSDQLSLSRAEFMFRNMGDIWIAKHAKENRIPLLAMDRPFKWVRENQQNRKYETIYANSLKKTGSSFDSSSIQDAVLRGVGPLSFLSIDKSLAVFVLAVGDAQDLKAGLDSFYTTCGDHYRWKLILLAIRPNEHLSRALNSVELKTEIHVIEARDTTDAQASLNALLADLPFDVGLYLDGRWRCTDETWAKEGLVTFLGSKLPGMALAHSHGQADDDLTLEHFAECAPKPDESHQRLSLALFRPGASLYLSPAKVVCNKAMATKQIADNRPDKVTNAAAEMLQVARTVLGGLKSAHADLSLPAVASHTPRVSKSAKVSKGPLASFFDRTVVINLERRPDRWAQASAQLMELGISPSRHRAIDGQWPEVERAYYDYAISPLRSVSEHMPRLDNSLKFYTKATSEAQRVAEIEQTSGRKAIVTAGAWGYLSTVIEVLQRAIIDDVTHLLMLDDDVIFHHDTNAIFESVLQELPDTWKIIQLGSLQYHWNANWIEWRGQHLYSQKGASVGSHAVGLHRDIFPFMLERAKRMEMPYDVGALSEATRVFPKDNFVIYPNLAIQSVTESDIKSSGFQDKASVERIFQTYRWQRDDYRTVGRSSDESSSAQKPRKRKSFFSW